MLPSLVELTPSKKESVGSAPPPLWTPKKRPEDDEYAEMFPLTREDVIARLVAKYGDSWNEGLSPVGEETRVSEMETTMRNEKWHAKTDANREAWTKVSNKLAARGELKVEDPVLARSKAHALIEYYFGDDDGHGWDSYRLVAGVTRVTELHMDRLVWAFENVVAESWDPFDLPFPPKELWTEKDNPVEQDKYKAMPLFVGPVTRFKTNEALTDGLDVFLYIKSVETFFEKGKYELVDGSVKLNLILDAGDREKRIADLKEKHLPFLRSLYLLGGNLPATVPRIEEVNRALRSSVDLWNPPPDTFADRIPFAGKLFATLNKDVEEPQQLYADTTFRDMQALWKLFYMTPGLGSPLVVMNTVDGPESRLHRVHGVEDADLEVGMSFLDTGFVVTTIGDPETALDESSCCLQLFTLPPGFQCFPMLLESSTTVLLPPLTVMMFEGTRRIGGKRAHCYTVKHAW